MMVMQANLGLTHGQIMTYIKGVIDIIIQLRRVGGKREVSRIWFRE